MGGTSKVAEICGITTGAVSQWRKNGIPSYRMDFFRLLRPELFSDVAAGMVETITEELRNGS